MKQKIGFVGAGHACLNMIKLFKLSEEYEVAVICDRNSAAPAITYAHQHGIPTVNSLHHINTFGIDFLVELTGKNPEVMKLIEENISEEVSIIDSDTAKMFFSLFSIMWKDKSERATDIIVTSNMELNKYFGNFSDILRNINILSLNAGIEANRAGEMGAGFAVIARAIKDLVNKSELATKECREELLKMKGIEEQMKSEQDDFSL